MEFNAYVDNQISHSTPSGLFIFTPFCFIDNGPLRGHLQLFSVWPSVLRILNLCIVKILLDAIPEGLNIHKRHEHCC
jgi:hypothetical protein